MKQRFFYGLLCATLLVVSCSSQPARVGAISGSSGPEILLPGGRVEEAKLLAMGMAESKGWTIVEANNQRLLLERPLPESSPQARLLSPDGALSRSSLQVETRMSERGNDVIVGLSSYVVVDPGTEQERRVDYTDDYQDELMISLNALASAWLENRTRIASEIPLPPDPDQVVIAEASTASPVDEPADDTWDSTLAPSTEASTAPSIATTTDTQVAPPTVPEAPLQAAEEPLSPSPLGADEPMPSGPLGTQESPSQAIDLTAGSSDSNDMLVLDSQVRRGLWTYYAEASARERGCVVGERGAVLLSVTTAFELYEVQCGGSPNLLLRCQGGVCREIN